MKKIKLKKPDLSTLTRNKKLLLLGGLVIMVLAVGYANYAIRYGSDAPAAAENDQEAEGVVSDSVTAANGDDYFAVFREERTSTREKEIGYIDAIVGSAETDEATKSEAQSQKLAIVEVMEKELSTEGLIKTKLNMEAVVTISEGAVSVVVGSSTLSQDQVTQIAEIVKDQTGESAQNIKIMPQS